MHDRTVGNFKTYRHGYSKCYHQIDGHCHIVTHPVVFFCTEPLCYENRKSTAESVQPAGDKKHQRTGTSDRCKCIYTDKLSGNDRIHNVIKLLKNISQEHRDHKHNDQFDRIPCCHVICSIFFHFYSSPTKSRKKHCALSCHFVILHLLITML